MYNAHVQKMRSMCWFSRFNRHILNPEAHFEHVTAENPVSNAAIEHKVNGNYFTFMLINVSKHFASQIRCWERTHSTQHFVAMQMWRWNLFKHFYLSYKIFAGKHNHVVLLRLFHSPDLRYFRIPQNLLFQIFFFLPQE